MGGHRPVCMPIAIIIMLIMAMVLLSISTLTTRWLEVYVYPLKQDLYAGLFGYMKLGGSFTAYTSSSTVEISDNIKVTQALVCIGIVMNVSALITAVVYCCTNGKAWVPAVVMCIFCMLSSGTSVGGFAFFTWTESNDGHFSDIDDVGSVTVTPLMSSKMGWSAYLALVACVLDFIAGFLSLYLCCTVGESKERSKKEIPSQYASKFINTSLLDTYGGLQVLEPAKLDNIVFNKALQSNRGPSYLPEVSPFTPHPIPVEMSRRGDYASQFPTFQYSKRQPSYARTRDRHSKKYGDDDYSKSQPMHTITRDRHSKKYGDDDYSKSQPMHARTRDRHSKKYGDDDYSKSQPMHAITRDRHSNKYGDDDYSKSQPMHARARDRHSKKYGDDDYSKIQPMHARTRDRHSKKYGDDDYSKSQPAYDGIFGMISNTQQSQTLDRVHDTDDSTIPYIIYNQSGTNRQSGLDGISNKVLTLSQSTRVDPENLAHHFPSASHSPSRKPEFGVSRKSEFGVSRNKPAHGPSSRGMTEAILEIDTPYGLSTPDVSSAARMADDVTARGGSSRPGHSYTQNGQSSNNKSKMFSGLGKGLRMSARGGGVGELPFDARHGGHGVPDVSGDARMGRSESSRPHRRNDSREKSPSKKKKMFGFLSKSLSATAQRGVDDEFDSDDSVMPDVSYAAGMAGAQMAGNYGSSRPDRRNDHREKSSSNKKKKMFGFLGKGSSMAGKIGMADDTGFDMADGDGDGDMFDVGITAAQMATRAASSRPSYRNDSRTNRKLMSGALRLGLKGVRAAMGPSEDDEDDEE